MIGHFGFVAISAMALLSPVAQAAPTPRGQLIAVSCSGATVVEGRKLAKQDGLKHGQHPKACFGRMQIYDGPNKQFVVVAPSANCAGGKAVDVYERSNAGPWYSFFEKPVCGSPRTLGATGCSPSMGSITTAKASTTCRSLTKAGRAT